jgi:prevent-host-death family protein
MITITSVDAQNRFGQLLDTAQREPITITRRGRPVAMLMAVEEFEARQQPGTAARAARQAVAAFRGAGKGGTVEQLFADRRAETVQEPAAAYQPASGPAKATGKKARS